MGKKDKKKKLGLGAAKTESKATKKAARDLNKEQDEESIEDILQSLQQHAIKDHLIVTSPVSPPSVRSGCSMVAHPRRPELFIFGGESFNGKNVAVFNDLYCFDTSKRSWKLIVAPSAPAARSSHQTVVYERDSKSLMLVGLGEFTSPSGAQFHHFKDVYSFDLDQMEWTKLQIPHGPCARSGHRWLLWKNQYVLSFGGFANASGEAAVFFNDLFVLSLGDMSWRAIHKEQKSTYENASLWPCARAGHCLVSDETAGFVYLFGGVSVEAVKRNLKENGKSVRKAATYKTIVHDDVLWRLDMKTYQWQCLKKKGLCPGLGRVGIASCSTAAGGSRRALLFGGCRDVVQEEASITTINSGRSGSSIIDDEDDEKVANFNDLFELSDETFHVLDVPGAIHSSTQLMGKQKTKKQSELHEDGDQATRSIFDWIPPSTESSRTTDSSALLASSVPSEARSSPATPAPRRSACICISQSILFMFAGCTELDNGREQAHSDLWRLDLSPAGVRAGWLQLVEDSVHDWAESDDEEEEKANAAAASDDEETQGVIAEEEHSDEEQDATDAEAEQVDALSTAHQSIPAPLKAETLALFFERTREFWLQSVKTLQNQSEKAVRKAAFASAKNAFDRVC